MMKRRGFLRMIGLLPVGGLLPVLEGAARSRQIVLDNGSTIDYGGAVGGGKTMTHLLYGDRQGGCLVPECYRDEILAFLENTGEVRHAVGVTTGHVTHFHEAWSRSGAAERM